MGGSPRCQGHRPDPRRPGGDDHYPGTQGGQRLRLRGKGLQRRDCGSGDLYVKLKIVVPQKLMAAERERFEKLAATSSFRAREAMTGGQR